MTAAEAPESGTAFWRVGNLLATRVTRADLPFFQDMFALPQMSTHKPDPRPSPPERIATLLEGDLAHWTQHEVGRWCVWQNGARIGMCGLTVKPEYEGLNISYHLHPEYWGRGTASALVRGMMDLAPVLPAWNRVYALVRPANAASIRVLEKAGYRLDGTVVHEGHPSAFLTRDFGGDARA